MIRRTRPIQDRWSPLNGPLISTPPENRRDLDFGETRPAVRRPF